MTLEEASKWIKNFESYLEWNQLVVDKKSTKNLIDLLESFLDAGMVSKMDTDESITATTEVRGPEGILVKIIEHYLDDNPLINRRHEFTICKQARGESFKTWWETKLRRAKECDLEKMTGKDWLALELIRGVSDTALQKKLLQEHNPTLPDLVRMAGLWQNADSAQTAFGTGVSLRAYAIATE